MLFALHASTFAYAQPADDIDHDVQCLIAVSILAENEDAKLKMSGMMAGLYFAGKIFGRDPDIDLVRRVKSLTNTLDGAKTRALLTECGAELTSRGQQLQDVGKALQQEAGKPS